MAGAGKVLFAVFLLVTATYAAAYLDDDVSDELDAYYDDATFDDAAPSEGSFDLADADEEYDINDGIWRESKAVENEWDPDAPVRKPTTNFKGKAPAGFKGKPPVGKQPLNFKAKTPLKVPGLKKQPSIPGLEKPLGLKVPGLKSPGKPGLKVKGSDLKVKGKDLKVKGKWKSDWKSKWKSDWKSKWKSDWKSKWKSNWKSNWKSKWKPDMKWKNKVKTTGAGGECPPGCIPAPGVKK